ncbi:MAG: hypothetical protein ACRD1G_14020, partial [Acidimicrobiales bacterium]
MALGQGGFADDSAPADALVAIPDPSGGWVVAATVHEARKVAGKVQGRRSTTELDYPLEVPAGDWAVRLRTTWVEPAYLETDASWCEPGGEPATPLGNGGAFGGKTGSMAPAVARRLADEHGRAVRVLLSREDVVRLGPKRPPIAAGIRSDGTGVLRMARTAGVAELVKAAAPNLQVEQVGVHGPPTSESVRGAGWMEAMVLSAVARAGGSSKSRVVVKSPAGARAEASIADDGRVRVRVECGRILDDVVLKSYCTGAAHMALGWVRSEGIALDGHGQPCDLSIRSFGVLKAREMPEVEVHLVESDTTS